MIKFLFIQKIRTWLIFLAKCLLQNAFCKEIHSSAVTFMNTEVKFNLKNNQG